MPFATINGARLAYDLAGSGPDAVLLHAGIADRHMWDREFEDLAADHRVLRFDMRGFGESDLPPGPMAMRDDVAALMDRLGLREAALIGCSIGAGAAIDVALVRPDLVRALVLVGAGIGGRHPPDDELTRRMTSIDELIERGEFEDAAEETLRFWIDGPTRAAGAVGGPVREALRRLNVDYGRRERDEWTKVEPRPLKPPAVDRLQEIRVPALVIVGADDIPFIHENSRLLRDRLQAELVVMEDAAHLPNLDHPERFIALVRGFLARV